VIYHSFLFFIERLDNAMAHQHPVRLEIIIVGAGIIGLAAAAALSRVGHKITVSKKCRKP
jgi:NADPH-dependent 2,4-dienoyl-CoA reductase/sulfur reductase-like enzyme